MFTFTALLLALVIDRLLGFHSQRWIKPAFDAFITWIQEYQPLTQLSGLVCIVIILVPLIFISSIVWVLLSFTFLTKWLGMVVFIWAALGLLDSKNIVEKLSITAKRSEKVAAHGVYWQAGQSTFSVIFWLIVAGPVVALSYRWIALTKDNTVNAEATSMLGRLQEIADWLPMRLLSITLIWVGDGKTNLRLWWQNKTSSTQKLIDTCGEEHAVDRVNRSLFAWLLVLAIGALATILL